MIYISWMYLSSHQQFPAYSSCTPNFARKKKCSSLATQLTSLQQPNCNPKKHVGYPVILRIRKGSEQLSSSCRIRKYTIPGSLAPPSCLMGNPVKGHSKLCPERVHQRVSSCEAWRIFSPETLPWPKKKEGKLGRKRSHKSWKNGDKKDSRLQRKKNQQQQQQQQQKKKKYNKKTLLPSILFSTPFSEKQKTPSNIPPPSAWNLVWPPPVKKIGPLTTSPCFPKGALFFIWRLGKVPEMAKYFLAPFDLKRYQTWPNIFLVTVFCQMFLVMLFGWFYGLFGTLLFVDS